VEFLEEKLDTSRSRAGNKTAKDPEPRRSYKRLSELEKETGPSSPVMKETNCSWSKQRRSPNPNEQSAAAESGMALPEEHQRKHR
jgi:hypothetical protein